MGGPIQLLNKRLYVVVVLPGTHSHKKGRNDERCSSGIFVFDRQTTAQQPVDRSLERVARAPLLLLKKHGDVVVDRKSGPHIMMLV